MTQLSSGALMWRRREYGIEVLLVHFGGPQWQHKDEGAWGIPKGLVEGDEDLAACALREFEEELGVRPEGALEPLGRIRQAGGKWVEAFAVEGDLNPEAIVSNRFTIEWPPRSGRLREFSEVDRAAWFNLDEARMKILPSQMPILESFARRL